MSILHKIMVSGLVFGLVFSVATDTYAQARKRARVMQKESVKSEVKEQKKVEKTSEEGAIIFRIEDIKPLTNEKTGLIDKCSFMVTVFNRMDVEVQEATLDFFWRDTISKKYKIANDDVQAVTKPEDALTIVKKTVTLEKIKPHRQKSFEEIVEMDKCFLLFDQLEYQVKTCIAEGDKVIIRNNQKIGTGSCGNMFDYINSKNPEYYSEFKDIPESVLQQQAEEEKEAELEGVKKSYEDVLKTIEKIDAELDKIAKVEEKKAEDEGEKTDAAAEDKKASNSKDAMKKDESVKAKKAENSEKANEAAQEAKAEKTKETNAK